LLFLRVSTAKYAALRLIFLTAHGVTTHSTSVDGFQLLPASRNNPGTWRYSHRAGANFANVAVYLLGDLGGVHPSATLRADRILLSEKACILSIQDARLTLAGLRMIAITMKSIGLVFPVLAAR